MRIDRPQRQCRLRTVFLWFGLFTLLISFLTFSEHYFETLADKERLIRKRVLNYQDLLASKVTAKQLFNPLKTGKLPEELGKLQRQKRKFIFGNTSNTGVYDSQCEQTCLC
jgi:hypothetical protein